MTYIHRQGEENNSNVELDEFVVLGAALQNQSLSHNPNEVPVQNPVHKQVNDLLRPVPPFVRVLIPLQRRVSFRWI